MVAISDKDAKKAIINWLFSNGLNDARDVFGFAERPLPAGITKPNDWICISTVMLDNPPSMEREFEAHDRMGNIYVVKVEVWDPDMLNIEWVRIEEASRDPAYDMYGVATYNRYPMAEAPPKPKKPKPEKKPQEYGTWS